MNTSQSIVFTVASLVIATGVALAAGNSAGTAQEQGMQHDGGMEMNHAQGDTGGMMGPGMMGPGGMMGNGMMGRGMMGNGMDGGMMGMMGACGQMMNARAPMSGMPKLPPGNEKLQLQMQAEMMQKMGEILSSYAARIPDTPSRPR
jgi:hypothetical protein